MGFFSGLKRLFFPPKPAVALGDESVVSTAENTSFSGGQVSVSEQKSVEINVFSTPRDEIMKKKSSESENETE